MKAGVVLFLGGALLTSGYGDEMIRIMAANTTSGTLQSYPTDNLGPVGGLSGPGNRIFQGLDPDIALIQEMNVGEGTAKNTAATYRAWVNGNFGTQFSYVVETGEQIPNGIVSRFPILSSGVWDDPEITNREFVWARIDIPGDKDLWAVSVHLSSGGGSGVRNLEAMELRARILAEIPAADYLVLGGDLNTSSRTESCVTTLSSVLVTGGPFPVDQNNVGGTNAGRDKPYDWVIPDTDLNAVKTTLTYGTRSFPNGLVYDSRVTSPYTFLPSPILVGDSAAPSMQHMAVVRAFLIPVNDAPTITAAANSASTEIVSDPEVREVVRGTAVGLSVLGADDDGEAALRYTWSVTNGTAAHVSFSSNGNNAAKNTTANFTAVGDYTLTATVRDVPGLTVTSSIRLRVVATAAALSVTPGSVSLAVGTSQGFAATLRDQFNQIMPSAFLWSVTGGGTVNASGVFTANTAGGPFTLSASASNLTGQASVTVLRAAAVVILDGASLTQTYDGSSRVVKVTTQPPGLPVTVLYNGTTIAPIQAGSYGVSAAVVSPNYQGSAAGTLVVAADPWALWKNTYFNQSERESGLADDPADPDADGHVNLAEYAMGSHPRIFSSPVAWVVDERGLTLGFTRPQNLPGILYGAEVSGDLMSWTPVPLVVVQLGAVETLEATVSPPLDSDFARFLRLWFKRE